MNSLSVNNYIVTAGSLLSSVAMVFHLSLLVTRGVRLWMGCIKRFCFRSCLLRENMLVESLSAINMSSTSV